MDDAAITTPDTRRADADNYACAGDSGRAIVLFVVTAAAVLGADLLIKWASFRYVPPEPIVLTPEIATDPYFTLRFPHDPVSVIPGVLHLQLTTNTGAVFGLGKGGRWVFVGVSLLALAIIGRIFWRSPARAVTLHVALALILAGALGNLYDRLWFQAVRDMFHLFPDAELPFGWTWPGPSGSRMLYPWIFNLADAALVLGVLTVLLITWAHELRRSKLQKAAD